VLWRHGRTAWNEQGRFQGTEDVPLDDVGRAQAERAAAMLAVLGPTAIVSSDLERARDTASALSRVSGVPVAIDVDLREIHAGTWQGQVRAELDRQNAADLLAWSRGDEIRPGGGETRAEVAERMVAAIDRALVGVHEGGTLVVVTHGGSARSAMGSLLGLPRSSWSALGVLANCSWSVLQETGWGDPYPAWRLAEYNAGSLPTPVLGDDR
jgi:broad specificity phosphatase PhoE